MHVTGQQKKNSDTTAGERRIQLKKNRKLLDRT